MYKGCSPQSSHLASGPPNTSPIDQSGMYRHNKGVTGLIVQTQHFLLCNSISVQVSRCLRSYICISTSYVVMDDFHRLFEVDARCRVLICTGCQYAVVPAHVGKHLRTHHKRLTLEQRRNIISAVDELLILARVPSDVIYPSPSDPPIVNLPVYFDGLKCSGVNPCGVPCLYICRTPRGIREHCEHNHGWVNSQKCGGDARSKHTHAKNKIWTENQIVSDSSKLGSGNTTSKSLAKTLQQMPRDKHPESSTFSKHKKTISKLQSVMLPKMLIGCTDLMTMSLLWFPG